MKLRGEKLLNLKFVIEVEKYPAIYSGNVKTKSEKVKANHAWNAISHKLDLPVEDCKKKWRNLRNMFSRHYQASIEGNTDAHRYYLFEAMQFSVPYIKKFGPKGTLIQISKAKPSPPTEKSTVYNPFGEPCLAAEEAEDDEEGDNTEYLEEDIEPPPGSDSPSYEYKSTKTNKESSLFGSSSDEKKRKVEKVEDPSANKLFVLSLLPEINCLTIPKMRLFRRQVLRLIDDLREDRITSE